MHGSPAEGHEPEHADEHTHPHPHPHDHHDLDPLTFGPDQLCFGCGPGNALGLRMRFRREADVVLTRFLPRPGHEGPPGILHGGLQATLVDELAAWTVVGLRGRMGFTTALEVKLLKPIRVDAEVLGRGWITAEATRSATIEVTLEQAGHVGVRGTVVYALPGVSAAQRILGRPLPESWRRFCGG